MKQLVKAMLILSLVCTGCDDSAERQTVSTRGSRSMAEPRNTSDNSTGAKKGEDAVISRKGPSTMTLDLKAAQEVWKELLEAMQNRNEEGVAQLTTRNGLDSLKKGTIGESHLDVFERLGNGWQRWNTRWQELKTPDEIKLLLGPEIKEHTFVFKKNSQGWKMDHWFPGD